MIACRWCSRWSYCHSLPSSEKLQVKAIFFPFTFYTHTWLQHTFHIPFTISHSHLHSLSSVISCGRHLNGISLSLSIEQYKTQGRRFIFKLYHYSLDYGVLITHLLILSPFWLSSNTWLFSTDPDKKKEGMGDVVGKIMQEKAAIIIQELAKNLNFSKWLTVQLRGHSTTEHSTKHDNNCLHTSTTTKHNQDKGKKWMDSKQITDIPPTTGLSLSLGLLWLGHIMHFRRCLSPSHHLLLLISLVLFFNHLHVMIRILRSMLRMIVSFSPNEEETIVWRHSRIP